jgi:hypothetical protein
MSPSASLEVRGSQEGAGKRAPPRSKNFGNARTPRGRREGAARAAAFENSRAQVQRQQSSAWATRAPTRPKNCLRDAVPALEVEFGCDRRLEGE